jgi:hypothetical protein
MCLLGWKKLCADVLNDSAPLKTFRSSFTFLRFAIRYFLLAMDGWKQADLEVRRCTKNESPTVQGSVRLSRCCRCGCGCWGGDDAQRTIKELQVEYGRVLTMLEMACQANDQHGVSQLTEAVQRMYAECLLNVSLPCWACV